MKKITLVLLAVIFVLSCVGLAACNKGAQEALDSYLLEQDNQVVEADFVLPATIGEYEVEWSSNSEAIKLTDRGEDYLAEISMGDELAEVTLTVSIGKLSKTFVVRVAAFDVYYLADRYIFPQDSATVSADFELDSSFTYEGKTATITWSVLDAYKQYITISSDGTKCIVNTDAASTNPAVRIQATFSYGGKTTTKSYRMTTSVPMSDLEEIDYWYNNTGVSIEIKGYVVEIATPYDEGYGNVSLYVVDEDFLGGFYVYRVKADKENADKVKPGVHVTITGTTNTNYNGLIETNSGGNLVVDEDIQAIDVRDHIYAYDQDVIGGVPAAIYQQSRLVSLTNWEVKSVAKSAPEEGETGTLFTLTKGGVDVSVAVSKYMEGAYKPTADDATWSALAALVGTVKKGDIVSVTGILGNYKGAQIMPLKASDVVVGGTKDPDGTKYPGKDAKAAIDAVAEALAAEGADKRITAEKTFTLPTDVNGVTVKYELCSNSTAVTLEGNTFKVVPPENEARVNVKATFTVKDGETVVYETVDFFRISTVVLTADIILDELQVPPKSALKDFELDSNEYAKWEVVEGTGITIEGNTAKVSRTGEDQRVTLKVTVVYNGETSTRNFRISVPANPYYGYVPEVVTTPAAGTYKLFLQQENLGKTLYFTGVMDGYYYETSEDVADAVDVVVANGSASGTYTFAFVDGTGATKYLYIEKSGKYTNVKFGSTPFDWTWEAERNVLIATLSDGDYYLGTYGNHNTISASELGRISDASVIGKTQFVARFVQMVQATDERKVADDKAALTLEESYTENFTLPTTGVNGSAITWAVTEGTAITVDGAAATVIRGAEDATVTLTATITCGEESDTKAFTVTVLAEGTALPGTEEDPYTVAEALAAAGQLAKGEHSEKVYILGTVVSIGSVGSYYKNLYIADGVDGAQLLVYSANLGDGIDAVYPNDTVLFYGYLTNHNGTLEVSSNKGDFVYMEEVTRGTSTITVDEASSANAQVVELSAESGTNGTTFTFKVTVNSGHQITAVKVNGVEVTASEGVYTGTIGGNTTVKVETAEEGAALPVLAASISFADVANRTVFDPDTDKKQVWEQNGITFTNTQASSRNEIGDYSDPVRCYQNSDITIEYAGIVKLVFDCAGTDRLLMAESISGGGVLTTDGTTVTITFETAVDSVTITNLTKQARINSIDVYTMAE